MYFWMIYMTLSFGFRALMEFIYIKESRQFIGSIIGLILVLIVTYAVYQNAFLS
ncbi:DUF4181 domain-containing protein [Paenibacillus yonginensis]|uniref:DUF4181 domain-containing protein n=1 Tax=Paenibacillus yonginensis TaxID=1462996 RepID=UPI0009F285A0